MGHGVAVAVLEAAAREREQERKRAHGLSDRSHVLVSFRRGRCGTHGVIQAIEVSLGQARCRVKRAGRGLGPDAARLVAWSDEKKAAALALRGFEEGLP